MIPRGKPRRCGLIGLQEAPFSSTGPSLTVPLAPLASCTVNWRLACGQTRCGALATLSKPAACRSFLEPAATLPECAEAEALDGARLCGELLSMCVHRAGQPCTAIILFIEMPILVGSTCSTCFSID